ncbi:hypothetical protein GJ496_004626 [Pomphorhynchus laevis]|nr:hypothetical protein GJ496_004626 [Pomphorhynchus laevis]
MAARMYRIGDYVYCDDIGSSNGTQPSNQTHASCEPYQIRRIDELFKTPYGNGGVEARVVCFYRRRDLSSTLLGMLDRQTITQSEEDETESNYSDGGSAVEATVTGFQSDYPELVPEERYYLKHREVFLSRQMESIPATCIRGKCQVNYFNSSAETYKSYLSNDNVFFYRYVYDPQQRTLSSDRGEVRIGSRHQAEIPDFISNPIENDCLKEVREELIWSPYIKPLADKEIDQVMLLARSVGTFARALDCSGSSVRSMDWSRSSGLHISAAAACRDITLIHAVDCLHKNDYDVGKAVLSLVPASGPVLCRDELEDWSAQEAFIFEESLDKYCKDFPIIRKEVLPWKSIKSIIEYYYMWKTTDRYSQRKRSKALANDGSSNKLKQVFIPPYSKPSPHQLQTADHTRNPSMNCDSCSTQHCQRWYKCPPPSLLATSSSVSNVPNTSNIAGILCDSCYKYWKHYGALKWKNITSIQTSVVSTSQTTTNQRTLLQHCTECDKELRGRHQFNRHLAFVHGKFKRRTHTSTSGLQPSHTENERVRDSFCLQSTHRTKLARLLCNDVLQLRKMWKNYHDINLVSLESELAAKTGEQISVAEKQLAKLRDEKHPVMQMSKPKDILECSELAFPLISPEEMSLFFAGLDDCSNSTKCIKRPKLLRRNTCLTSGGIQNPINRRSMNNHDLLQQTHSNTAIGIGRHFPKMVESLDMHYIDGTDGIYVVATRTHRQARRNVPISIIRKAARYPWRSIKRAIEERNIKRHGAVVLSTQQPERNVQ